VVLDRDRGSRPSRRARAEHDERVGGFARGATRGTAASSRPLPFTSGARGL
jgi:hypothetical protein